MFKKKNQNDSQNNEKKHKRMATECIREYVYHNSWNIVIQAYQERFRNLPHPKIPSLTAMELENFSICSSNEHKVDQNDDDELVVSWIGKGHIKPDLPSWILRWVKLDDVVFITENKVDHKNKKFTIRIRNESFQKIFEVNEEVAFSVHPENSEWTLYQQRSEFKILVWLAGFESSAQNAVLKKYVEGYQEGRDTDEAYILDILKKNPVPQFGYIESKVRESVLSASPTSRSIDCLEGAKKDVDNNLGKEDNSIESNRLADTPVTV
jgi:hypothetical protein